jgi:hypothetical protein
MFDYFKQVLTAQYKASLAMLNQCIEACPSEHWEGRIANNTFRWVAYYALFFTDLYLSPSEHAFELRDLHRRGGDEREPVAAPGLSKEDALTYVPICRQKIYDALAAETEASLTGRSGFSWYKITRGEMHLVNIRHI